MTTTITAQLDRVAQRLSQPAFLQNKGLSNEVGLHIFCYDPADEPAVSRCFSLLQNDPYRPFHLIECDLYKIFLQICEERRILPSIPAQEQRHGTAYLLRQLQKVATPEAYVQKMQYSPHRPGDVLLLCGVGKVYPFMRAHSILNNIQPYFADIPVLLLYPGSYNGQQLRLFDRFVEDNYYRAFDLL